jgi:putative FmdB family regulatory protein
MGVNGMAVYEYYCAVCGATFEKLVPMSAATASTICPEGHEGAMRKLSVVASLSRGDGNGFPMMGGCACGGSCTCHG